MFSLTAIILMALCTLLSSPVTAWILPVGRRFTVSRTHSPVTFPIAVEKRVSSVWMSISSSAAQDDKASSNRMSSEEQEMVQEIYDKCVVDEKEPESDALKQAVLEALPTLPPKLIVKLRQSEPSDSNVVRAVSQQLNAILEESLEKAKTTLLGLLNAGEVRKLDSLIGKAAREGKLDTAFFNVLSMNIQDAARQEQQDAQPAEEGTATRLQILKHVYTRCQEEVEKSIPPAMALLNKLLRTEQESIRANLYRHYLTPQDNVIETPDGKKLELTGSSSSAVLVPLQDFTKAIDDAVLQIRTVENAGGTDRASAAAMVESFRQVAKEARIIIGESYGMESDELKILEEGLQPVFRPTSPESPYIQGKS